MLIRIYVVDNGLVAILQTKMILMIIKPSSPMGVDWLPVNQLDAGIAYELRHSVHHLLV